VIWLTPTSNLAVKRPEPKLCLSEAGVTLGNEASICIVGANAAEGLSVRFLTGYKYPNESEVGIHGRAKEALD
jgi:hypothetical protein